MHRDSDRDSKAGKGSCKAKARSSNVHSRDSKVRRDNGKAGKDSRRAKALSNNVPQQLPPAPVGVPSSPQRWTGTKYSPAS